MTSGFYGSVLFLFLHGGYIGVCFVIINLSLTYLLLFSVLDVFPNVKIRLCQLREKRENKFYLKKYFSECLKLYVCRLLDVNKVKIF